MSVSLRRKIWYHKSQRRRFRFKWVLFFSCTLRSCKAEVADDTRRPMSTNGNFTTAFHFCICPFKSVSQVLGYMSEMTLLSELDDTSLLKADGNRFSADEGGKTAISCPKHMDSKLNTIACKKTLPGTLARGESHNHFFCPRLQNPIHRFLEPTL